jgi:single-strand DNA-binding protein
MSSVNKVILVGNLTRNPELRHTSNKKAVCVIGLATNRYWTDQSGKKHEETEFHRLIAWDKLAETCHQYLRKGRKVYAEGRLQTRPYAGQDGIEKHGTEIVLEHLEILDSMPKDVKQTMELQDAVAETSNGVPQQV